MDEAARRVSLATVGNPRSTPSLYGAGYIEMLARQITDDLRRIRDRIAPGQSKPLLSKGISFGSLARRTDGSWITKAVEGLPPQSLRRSRRRETVADDPAVAGVSTSRRTHQYAVVEFLK